jgi:peptidoglycan/xylan/chitin deacetylase (PgdA/CDA1 family)
MIFCASVDDVCLDGYSTEEHLANLLRFFAEQHVRATFFTVPRAERIALGNRARYVDLLKQAVSEGHAVGQHGLEHDRFETGIPAQIVLDLPHEGPARERLARDREAIEANLGVAPLRERLATGRRILEDALGFEIGGFRAPCLSICDNLFHALDAERYGYDSSRHFQDAGWDIINNREYHPLPITRERFDEAQYPGGLMRTLPLTAEYTWYLPLSKYSITMDLARHDFIACMRAGIPFVPVCHVSPVQQCENNCGFDFYRELLDFAREQASANGEPLDLLSLAETAERRMPAVA